MALNQQEMDTLNREVDAFIRAADNSQLGTVVYQWAMASFPANNPTGDRNYSDFINETSMIMDSLLETGTINPPNAAISAVDIVAGIWLNEYVARYTQVMNQADDRSYGLAQGMIDKALNYQQATAPQTGRNWGGGYVSQQNQNYQQTQYQRGGTNYGVSRGLPQPQPAPPRAQFAQHTRPVSPGGQADIGSAPKVTLRNQSALNQQPQHGRQAPQIQQVQQPKPQQVVTTQFIEKDDVLTVQGPSTYPGKGQYKAYFLSRAASYHYPYFENKSVPYTFNPANSYLILGLREDDTVGFEILEKNEMNREAAKYAVRIRPTYRQSEIIARTDAILHHINGVEVEPELIYNNVAQGLLLRWAEEGKIKAGTTFDGLTNEQKNEFLLESSKINAKLFDDALAKRKVELMKSNNIDELKNGLNIVESKGTSLSTTLQAHIEEKLIDVDPYLVESRGYHSRVRVFTPLITCKTIEERDNLNDLLVSLQLGQQSNLDIVHFALENKQIPLPLYEKLNRQITLEYKRAIITYLNAPDIAELFTDFVMNYGDLTEYLKELVSEGKYKAETLLTMSKDIYKRIATLATPTEEELKDLYPQLSTEKRMRIGQTTLFTHTTAKVLYLPNTAGSLVLEQGIQKLPKDNFRLIHAVSEKGLKGDNRYYIYTSDGCLYETLFVNYSYTIIDSVALG